VKPELGSAPIRDIRGQRTSAKSAVAPSAVHGEQYWALRRVTDIKLRAFARPGEALQLEARLERVAPDAASLRVETRADGRTIGSASLDFTPETRS
jgi:hypothetical protein